MARVTEFGCAGAGGARPWTLRHARSHRTAPRGSLRLYIPSSQTPVVRAQHLFEIIRFELGGVGSLFASAPLDRRALSTFRFEVLF
eukprot:6346193-Prymnesium_polylepis.2